MWPSPCQLVLVRRCLSSRRGALLRCSSAGVRRAQLGLGWKPICTSAHLSHKHGPNELSQDLNVQKKEMSMPELVRHLFGYIWPKNDFGAKARVTGAMGLLIGSKLLNVQVPFLLKDAVDSLGDSALASQPGVSVIVGSIIIGYGVARAGATLFNELRNAVFSSVSQKSVRRVAGQVFSRLHHLDLSFHLQRQTGALGKAIDRGTRGVNTILKVLVFNIAPTLFEVSLVSGILWYTCGLPYVVVTLSSVVAYTLYTVGITKWRTTMRQEMNRADNEAASVAMDSLLNYETVKYFNNEKYELTRYDAVLRKYERASIKTDASLAVLNFGQNAIFTLGLTVAMLLAAKGALEGSLSAGDLVMVNGLIFQLSVPLNFLGSSYREIRQAMTDMQALFALNSMTASIRSEPNAIPLVLCKNEASIRFDNVGFSYLSGQPILKGLSFEVPSGRRVAIVGGSGSGKSTAVRLLYRLYDPTEGRVMIGGHDIRHCDVDSMRRNVAVVPQDAVLFHDTIAHNIRYGNLDATDDQVQDAARMADLHDSIMRMRDRYNTRVGERGLKLSGGEKQRVAIARAILKNTPILIWDEATSSLDALTEQRVLSAMNAAAKGRTCLVIAHRLSTIVDADEILVLDGGKVVDRGTHEQLLASDGLYASLWRKQAMRDSEIKQKSTH